MDRSIPGEKIENLAIKVNINTSYNLGTSWLRVCVHTKHVSHKAQGSSLNLYLVAMIIQCSSVSSGVHATPDIFSFFFFSQMPLMEKKVSFFLVKKCKKKNPLSECDPIPVAEIILKF